MNRLTDTFQCEHCRANLAVASHVLVQYVSCEEYYREDDRLLLAEAARFERASAAERPGLLRLLLPEDARREFDAARNELERASVLSKLKLSEDLRRRVRVLTGEQSAEKHATRAGRPLVLDLRRHRVEVRLTVSERADVDAAIANSPSRYAEGSTYGAFMRDAMMEAIETRAARFEELLGTVERRRDAQHAALDPREYRVEARFNDREFDAVQNACEMRRVPPRRFARVALMWSAARVLRRVRR